MIFFYLIEENEKVGQQQTERYTKINHIISKQIDRECRKFHKQVCSCFVNIRCYCLRQCFNMIVILLVYCGASEAERHLLTTSLYGVCGFSPPPPRSLEDFCKHTSFE